jgi:hypothetical protein
VETLGLVHCHCPPTSWTTATNASDEFTGRMFEAINGMLLGMLAAVARKDYDDRRRRQAQGQAKAKAEGKYKGHPEDTGRNEGIAGMLAAGQSWGAIQNIKGAASDVPAPWTMTMNELMAKRLRVMIAVLEEACFEGIDGSSRTTSPGPKNRPAVSNDLNATNCLAPGPLSNGLQALFSKSPVA